MALVSVAIVVFGFSQSTSALLGNIDLRHPGFPPPSIILLKFP
jgi:hypothetical protein